MRIVFEIWREKPLLLLFQVGLGWVDYLISSFFGVGWIKMYGWAFSFIVGLAELDWACFD